MKNNQVKNLFIVSGPSGAGEDSIIEGLKKFFLIERVITTTTRAMRPKEEQGNPYYFISQEEFTKGIENNKFFEWAQEYNDNYYGVSKEEIKRVGHSGKIGIWKIAYKGVVTAKKIMPNVVAILISAPIDILEKRIRERNPEYSEEFIQKRLEYSREFLRHKNIYDYEVVNEQGKLNKAIEKTAEIIKKHLNIDKQ